MIHQSVAAAAQIGDPAAFLELSGPVYALLSFLSLLVVAAVLLQRRTETVDHAVDHATDGLPLAAVYGVIPFGLVVFGGGYVLSQTARAGVSSRVLGWAVASIVVTAILVLAALGYVVIGAYVTELEGERRLWTGAVVGAALGAIPWLLLPTQFALAVWVVVAAIGLGGTTQEWVHGERTVESEARG